MANARDEYVKCPHCGAVITQLSFRMIQTQEERYSEKKMLEMQLEIEQIEDELKANKRLSTAKRMILNNRIEHLQLQMKNPIITYKERVYVCPECEKILAIMPSNDMALMMEMLTSATFDIRNLS